MSCLNLISEFEKLNEMQKRAIEWNEGPLLVLAGPGSGKTKVLTCRIARILNDSRDKNFRILGLTFTNKAADEMRSRVAKLVPGLENRLFLGTFHSFCADILRQHGSHLNIKPNFNIYSQDVDLEAVLDSAVEEAKKTSSLITDWDKKSLPIIQNLKSHLISPEDCLNVFMNLKYRPDFGYIMKTIYQMYEHELSIRNALDFNSLIFKTHELFMRFPAFVKRYRSVYPYLCIDEFQDTNSAQYKLVTVLAGSSYRNLFIVADDDQIIYQWNGASHQRISQFIKDFSSDVIQLPMNYRCPIEIVELANNLISHNSMRTTGKKPLEAYNRNRQQGTVRLTEVFDDMENEVQWLAKDINSLHSKELDSVVVLARTRKLLEKAKDALNRESIDAIISQRKNEFQSSPMIFLHSVLRLTNDKNNSKYFEAVCGTFKQITDIDSNMDEIISQNQISEFGLLHEWIKMMQIRSIDKKDKRLIEIIYKYLIKSRDFIKFSNEFINWYNSNIMEVPDDLDKEGEPQDIFNDFKEELCVWQILIREIINQLGDDVTLEAFLQELQMHSKETPPKPNAVTLMTIHSAKGKEFKHVYLIGLVDDELPSFQSIKKGDNSPEMEEERRNCFVAITRTITTLTLSYARRYRGWTKKPSRFLFEMGLLP